MLVKAALHPWQPCRDMERVAALVHNVSATFGRRDFLRRNMDKIEAMIADSGAVLALVPCLLFAAYIIHHICPSAIRML